MSEQLKTVRQAKTIGEALKFYLVGLVVLAPIASLIAALFGTEAAFSATPFLAVALVVLVYAWPYISDGIGAIADAWRNARVASHAIESSSISVPTSQVVNIHVGSVEVGNATGVESSEVGNATGVESSEIQTLAAEIATEVVSELRRELLGRTALEDQALEAGREYAFVVVLTEQAATLKYMADILCDKMSRESHKKRFRSAYLRRIQEIVSSLSRLLDFQWFSSAAARYGGIVKRRYELFQTSHQSLTAELNAFTQLLNQDQSSVSEEQYQKVFKRIEEELIVLSKGQTTLNDECYLQLQFPQSSDVGVLETAPDDDR